MQQPACVCEVEARLPKAGHQESSTPPLFLGSQHGYVVCDASVYREKHTDQNSVKHRDGWHALDLFINVRCVENWILILIENVPSAVSASNHRSVSAAEKSVAS